jgi:hypothetical protein
LLPALTTLNPPPKNNENLLRVTCFTVAGKRGRTLKNRSKKTTLKFFTSQLVTRNSQPPPPGSKKLAVDLGHSLADFSDNLFYMINSRIKVYSNFLHISEGILRVKNKKVDQIL